MFSIERFWELCTNKLSYCRATAAYSSIARSLEVPAQLHDAGASTRPAAAATSAKPPGSSLFQRLMTRNRSSARRRGGAAGPGPAAAAAPSMTGAGLASVSMGAGSISYRWVLGPLGCLFAVSWGETVGGSLSCEACWVRLAREVVRVCVLCAGKWHVMLFACGPFKATPIEMDGEAQRDMLACPLFVYPVWKYSCIPGVRTRRSTPPSPGLMPPGGAVTHAPPGLPAPSPSSSAPHPPSPPSNLPTPFGAAPPLGPTSLAPTPSTTYDTLPAFLTHPHDRSTRGGAAFAASALMPYHRTATGGLVGTLSYSLAPAPQPVAAPEGALFVVAHDAPGGCVRFLGDLPDAGALAAVWAAVAACRQRFGVHTVAVAAPPKHARCGNRSTHGSVASTRMRRRGVCRRPPSRLCPGICASS